MSDLTSEIDAAEGLIVELADEYVARCARGERPDIEEYAARWPGDPRVVRQVLASLKLVRLSSVVEASEATLEAADAAGRLGDFQILREIGRGGMGVVYEAEQLSLGRRIALKILPFAGVLDPRQLARFKNEALAAAQLDHPNLVDVIAVGCDRGIHYYAMRLIEGPTLAEVIGELQGSGAMSVVRCPLSVATDNAQRTTKLIAGISTDTPRDYYSSVARVVAEVAQALDYAHQSGVIHRDVKPSNILLDARGKPWVTDFGLARLETNPELTMTGDLLGTLRYMSPEQISGDRSAIDYRTDIYSLGATLYEVLTLRSAFSAPDRAELLRRIAIEPPRSPRKLAKSLPVELETIALKALEKNPLDRYRTAGEMADDLQRFLEHRPIHARRSRVMAHAKALWRRHQMLFVAVLLTLLAASSIASLLVWQQRQQAVEQHALVVEREADLRQRLYATDLKLAHQAWRRGDLARARDLLDRYAGPAGEELREFAWHYLASLLAARPAPLTVLRPGQGSVYCVQFSHDGKHLAAACGNGHATLWNVADWSLRFNLAAHQPADADCVAFSPDGKLLVSGGEDGWLRLWNVETGELLRSMDARQKDTLTVAISPDGRTLAAGGIDGMVRLWGLPGGEPRDEFRASNGRVQHLAFSPDGAKLATAGSDANAMISDVATWKRLVGLPSQSQPAFSVAFSAKGDELALGSSSGLVALVDPARGSADSLLGVRPAQVRAVAFSPVAPLLASAGSSGAVDIWDTISRSLTAKFQGHGRRIWSVGFSPDGKLLASGGDDGSIHIWNPNIESGTIHAEHAEAIYELKFAADENPGLSSTSSWDGLPRPSGTNDGLTRPPHRGESSLTPRFRPASYLLTATDKQVLVSWDAATLDRLAARALPAVNTHELAFDPDRRKVAVRTGEGQVWLGDTMGGRLVQFDPGHKTPVAKAALARDGRLLLWYADRTLEVWDTAVQTLLDRRQLAHIPGGWPTATSRDGRLVAANCEGALLIYDMEKLAPWFVSTKGLEDLYAIALSPDNRWLAAGRRDGSISFFDTETGEIVFSLTGHQHWVDSMAFSPDGRTLASAGHGGGVRLWHVATREELFIVRRLDSGGHLHIDFSPDGRRLAAATGDRAGRGHVFVWSTEPADP